MSAIPLAARRREPLAAHTSLKVGGPAELFAVARTADDVVTLLRWARCESMPVRVIGGGSNLLVADGGVDGLVVKLQLPGVRVEEREGGPVLVAGAGAPLASLARRVSKAGLSSLEWAANVPGTVGGAVVNNAGAFGGEIASSLLAAAIVDADGRRIRLTAEALGYRYRSSALKRGELGTVAVVEAELRLRRADPAETQARIAAFEAQRARSQPRLRSAGSVFANPPGDFSGRLVEAAGLKGRRVGAAQVSPVHANFIVNLGGATAADVYTLMRQVQDEVVARCGVWLEPEIELLGRWTPAEREALRRPGGQHAREEPNGPRTGLAGGGRLG